MEIWRVTCALLCVVCASSTETAAKESSATIMESREMHTGALDTSNYLSFFLLNGIRVVLVENPEMRTERVVVDVDAGAEYDSFEGTACLVEHLLIRGTQKYPGTPDYREFIRGHGGDRREQTTLSNTTYMYRMPATAGEEVLNEAIDRLAQIFISPTFPAEFVREEIAEMEFAYRKAKLRDICRTEQVELWCALREHPLHRFCMGNWGSLVNKRLEARSEAIEFYEKHYLPQNMVILICTPRKIDYMKKMVVEKFGGIGAGVKKTRVPRINSILPYPSQVFSRVLWVMGTQNVKQMTITYILPEECDDVDRKPHLYLKRLLEQKGKGTLSKFLREQSLIVSLTASFVYDHSYRYGKFVITVKMTGQGLQKYERVVAAILGYIEMVKERPVNLSVMEVAQKSGRNDFNTYTHLRFNTDNEMRGIAQGMRDLGIVGLMSREYLIEKIDADAVWAFNNMLENNFFVTVLDPAFRDQWDENGQRAIMQQEYWYGTCYRKLRYRRDEEMIRELRKGLGKVVFPTTNEFIVTDLSIKCGDGDVWAGDLPVLLTSDAWSKLWYRMDDYFKVPEVRLGFVFRTNYRLHGAKNEVMAKILRRFVHHAAIRDLQPAFEAGYAISFNSWLDHRGEIRIEISGYTEKMADVVRAVFSNIAKMDFSESSNFVTKKCYENLLRSVEKDLVLEGSEKLWQRFVTENGYLAHEELEHLKTITCEDMTACADQLFGSSILETLIYGNMYPHEAAEIHRQAVEIFQARYPKISVSDFTEGRVKLVEGRTPVFYTSVPGFMSCVQLHIEIGDINNQREVLLADLLLSVMRRCFNSDQKSKPYFVHWCKQSVMRDKFANTLMYTVEGGQSADVIYNGITNYIDYTIPPILAALSDAEFGRYKEAALETLKVRKGQQMEFDYMMSKIRSGKYDFDARSTEAEMIQGFTKHDLVRFVEDKLLRRRSMAVMTISENMYENSTKRLKRREESQNGQLTLVHIDSESIAQWRDKQTEYYEEAQLVIDVDSST